MSRARVRLLEPGTTLLHQLRTDHAAWQRVAFEAAGPNAEVGAIGRMQTAWALQYYGGADDGALIRFLLEQETAFRAADSARGMGETMEILGWLVARDR